MTKRGPPPTQIRSAIADLQQANGWIDRLRANDTLPLDERATRLESFRKWIRDRFEVAALATPRRHAEYTYPELFSTLHESRKRYWWILQQLENWRIHVRPMEDLASPIGSLVNTVRTARYAERQGRRLITKSYDENGKPMFEVHALERYAEFLDRLSAELQDYHAIGEAPILPYLESLVGYLEETRQDLLTIIDVQKEQTLADSSPSTEQREAQTRPAKRKNPRKQ